MFQHPLVPGRPCPPPLTDSALAGAARHAVHLGLPLPCITRMTRASHFSSRWQDSIDAIRLGPGTAPCAPRPTGAARP